MSKTLRESIQELPIEVNGNGWAVIDRADVLSIVAEHERETICGVCHKPAVRLSRFIDRMACDECFGIKKPD